MFFRMFPIYFYGLFRGLLATAFWGFFSFTVQAQVPAVDSMGVNMGKKNWKAALHWALQAGEAIPEDKYWRYLNAAEFASRLEDAELTFKYLSYVVDSEIATNASFSSEAFNWLHQHKRWKALMNKVKSAQKQEQQQRIQASQSFRQLQANLLEANQAEIMALRTISSAEQLYKQLQQRPRKNIPVIKGRYQYAWLKLNDLVEVPYLIQLPANFDKFKAYPLLIVLHGGVRMSTAFPEVPDSTHTFFGRAFMQKASAYNVIAAFPYSTKQYNWMLPDAGFSLVPSIVQEVKKMYPVDDARVYVTGHSNGATGAFSYLLKQPSLFAGFSGINNRPQVRTGGTFIKNAQNRSFYNVATDYDYYYPLSGHRSLQNLARTLTLDWQNTEVTGKRDHGYLMSVSDSVTDRVYQNLFTAMQNKTRNPFRPDIYWECDDTQHGRCDWLEITTLDTTAATQANWYQRINFKVNNWRNVENPELLLDSTANAFVFPRRSGAVEARYQNNTFSLKSSGVKTITLYLSPEMVNLKKPIRVKLNGRRVYRKKVTMSKKIMLENFQKQYDHQAVWVNRLIINVPESSQ